MYNQSDTSRHTESMQTVFALPELSKIISRDLSFGDIINLQQALHNPFDPIHLYFESIQHRTLLAGTTGLIAGQFNFHIEKGLEQLIQYISQSAHMAVAGGYTTYMYGQRHLSDQLCLPDSTDIDVFVADTDNFPRTIKFVEFMTHTYNAKIRYKDYDKLFDIGYANMLNYSDYFYPVIELIIPNHSRVIQVIAKKIDERFFLNYLFRTFDLSYCRTGWYRGQTYVSPDAIMADQTKHTVCFSPRQTRLIKAQQKGFIVGFNTAPDKLIEDQYLSNRHVIYYTGDLIPRANPYRDRWARASADPHAFYTDPTVSMYLTNPLMISDHEVKPFRSYLIQQGIPINSDDKASYDLYQTLPAGGSYETYLSEKYHLTRDQIIRLYVDFTNKIELFFTKEWKRLPDKSAVIPQLDHTFVTLDELTSFLIKHSDRPAHDCMHYPIHLYSDAVPILVDTTLPSYPDVQVINPHLYGLFVINSNIHSYHEYIDTVPVMSNTIILRIKCPLLGDTLRYLTSSIHPVIKMTMDALNIDIGSMCVIGPVPSDGTYVFDLKLTIGSKTNDTNTQFCTCVSEVVRVSDA